MSALLVSPFVAQMRTTSRPSKFTGATQARPEATTRRTSARTSPSSAGGTTSSTARPESFATDQPALNKRSLMRSMTSTARSTCAPSPCQPAADKARNNRKPKEAA